MRPHCCTPIPPTSGNSYCRELRGPWPLLQPSFPRPGITQLRWTSGIPEIRKAPEQEDLENSLDAPGRRGTSQRSGKIPLRSLQRQSLSSCAIQATFSLRKEDLVQDGTRENRQTFMIKPTLGELQFFLRAACKELIAYKVFSASVNYYVCQHPSSNVVCAGELLVLCLTCSAISPRPEPRCFRRGCSPISQACQRTSSRDQREPSPGVPYATSIFGERQICKSMHRP